MPVGVLILEIQLPYSHSLKDKRAVLLKIRDRLRSRFNVAIAELDHQDLWQQATLGVVSISNSQLFLESVFQKVLAESEKILGHDVVDYNLEFFDRCAQYVLLARVSWIGCAVALMNFEQRQAARRISKCEAGGIFEVTMPVPGRRQERLAEQIRDEIAEILTRGELQDPRIGFTTVTRVELSADLTHVRVLVSVLGQEGVQEQTLAGLASATGYLRREIARRLKLRRSPELAFVIDHGAEEAVKIESLLEKIRHPGEG